MLGLGNLLGFCQFLLNKKTLKATLTLDPITIDPLTNLSSSTVEASMLRLDKLHPIVSGNKWFKLRYYIEEAISQSCTTIASFGGPYSNHLVALAYAAKENNVKSIGYVRASKEDTVTPSLQEAQAYGMQLEFIGRTNFQKIKNDLLKDLSKANLEKYSFDKITYWKEPEGWINSPKAKFVNQNYTYLKLK